MDENGMRKYIVPVDDGGGIKIPVELQSSFENKQKVRFYGKGSLILLRW